MKKHIDPTDYATYVNVGFFDGVYEMNPIDMNKLEEEIYSLERTINLMSEKLSSLFASEVPISNCECECKKHSYGYECGDFECLNIIKNYYFNEAKKNEVIK